MSFTTYEALAQELAALRAAGVKTYRDVPDGMEVEFFPLTPAVSGPGPIEMESLRHVADKFSAEVPVCPCGHSELEHNAQGFCLHACDPKKCEPPKEASPE